MNTTIFAIAMCLINPSPNVEAMLRAYPDMRCELENHRNYPAFDSLDECQQFVKKVYKGWDKPGESDGLDVFCAKKEVPAWQRAN